MLSRKLAIILNFLQTTNHHPTYYSSSYCCFFNFHHTNCSTLLQMIISVISFCFNCSLSRSMFLSFVYSPSSGIHSLTHKKRNKKQRKVILITNIWITMQNRKRQLKLPFENKRNSLINIGTKQHFHCHGGCYGQWKLYI